MRSRLRIGMLVAASLLSLHTARRTLAQAPSRPISPAAADSPLMAEIDPALWRLIASTPAIDNHAHPVLPPPNERTDRGFDALPVDHMEPETDVVAWREDNPQLPLAWRALWGVSLNVPLDPASTKALHAARDAVRQREGQHFDAWLLDQAGIGTMVANRVTMGDGLTDTGTAATRFRWVPYDDALLFPLDNSALAAENPDRKLFFPMEDRLRARYLADLGLTAVPATLDDYLARVVTPTLERQRAGGAIAVKFEMAYLRGFMVTNPDRATAAALYTQGLAKPGTPQPQYKPVEDYVFRYIARECGRLGMAVHLHVLAGGGGYFAINGGNPLLLEPVFNDPTLRKTNFVMLHGGWPFVREAGALLQKPNVYLDLSQQDLTFPPRTLAGWLREWLQTYPDKILFGTDGYPLSDAEGWEESTWIAARNGRLALALALSGMLHDAEISRARAEAIAVEVLSGTALTLYPLHAPARP